jgi:hypothetical protein
MNKITPNQLATAKQELSNKGLKDFKIPQEIQLAEQGYYYVVGLNERPNSAGMGMITSASLTWYDERKWQAMQKEINSKAPLYTVIGGGTYKMVVILHNPAMPNTLDRDWQKEQVLSLVKEGKNAKDIAKAMKLKELDIEELVKSTKPKGLSPIQKGKVKEMLENGTPQTDEGLETISKELDIELDRIKAYVSSL